MPKEGLRLVNAKRWTGIQDRRNTPSAFGLSSRIKLQSSIPIPERILMTGATGFIGSHLIRGMLDDGHAVAALVRSGTNQNSIDLRTSQIIFDDGSGDLKISISDFAPTVIIHAATYFVGQHKPADIQPLISSNIEFGIRLLEAARFAGVRKFINFGTTWQHDEIGENRPATLYAATKTAFETILNSYAVFGMQILTLKLSDTYGPRDPRGKIIALLFKHGRSGEPLELSPGAQKISLVHVDDVIDAVRVSIQNLKDAEISTNSFAVRGLEVVSLKELVTIFQEASGLIVDARWGARPYRDREVMTPWLGELLPNWRPKIDLRLGIANLSLATETN